MNDYGDGERRGQRLDRIELKLDKIKDSLVDVARQDERLGNVEDKIDTQTEKMNKFGSRLEHLERLVASNALTVGNISKLFWVVIVAVVGAIVSNIMGFL